MVGAVVAIRLHIVHEGSFVVVGASGDGLNGDSRSICGTVKHQRVIAVGISAGPVVSGVGFETMFLLCVHTFVHNHVHFGLFRRAGAGGLRTPALRSDQHGEGISEVHGNGGHTAYCVTLSQLHLPTRRKHFRPYGKV